MLSFIRHAPRAACVTIAMGALLAARVPALADPLTLEAAIERTLEKNPELRVFESRLREQSARTDLAYLRPPLELRGEVEDALGTGRTHAFDTAEITLSVARVLERGGKREARVAAAAAGSDSIRAERAATALDVLTEVARRFVHVASDQDHLVVTQRATALAHETVDATSVRVAAARAPDVELRRAKIALARAEVDQEHAEHELLSSRRKLAAMWGDAELQNERVAADLYRIPALEPFESLTEQLADNPDFLVFASEARLRDAEIRLAETQARSSITVNAGVKSLQATDDLALVFGFTMPLGSSQRARGEVARASALRGQADAEREAHRVRAEAQLFELYQELRHSITEAEVLRASVLPEMEAALEATRDAFERGRYSYLEWADAQRELVDVQRSLIDASANAHLYRAEIERLTGESLPVVNPENQP
jgi:cobalt-zinc-cadmium efflux system outer membrane protein